MPVRPFMPQPNDMGMPSGPMGSQGTPTGMAVDPKNGALFPQIELRPRHTGRLKFFDEN